MKKKTKNPKIEVLKSGTFIPMSGNEVTFTSDDLANIADSYDGENAPCPVVIGHPKTDAPAYGWVKQFSYDKAKDRLCAILSELAPSFCEAIENGAYKKISMSLFAKDATSNPNSGSFYPKVGGQGQISETVRERYEDAIRALKDIQSGKMDIIANDNVNNAIKPDGALGSINTYNPKACSDDILEGYI